MRWRALWTVLCNPGLLYGNKDIVRKGVIGKELSGSTPSGDVFRTLVLVNQNVIYVCTAVGAEEMLKSYETDFFFESLQLE